MPRTGAYSSKGRRDTLTGGTKDVNPQYMNLSIVQSGVDVYTQVSFPIPIQRLQNTGRAQVMEVLKVIFSSTSLTTAAAGNVYHNLITQLTTKSFAAGVVFSEPTLFAMQNKENANAFTAGGTGMTAYDFEPYEMNTNDGAGHGILIASDNIFVGLSSVATGVANRSDIKILYRWKDVSISEYVGIVQSQQ